MKTNAIIRIVAWSIAILVLTGVLLAGIGLGGLFNFRVSNNPVESATPSRLTEPTLAITENPVHHQTGTGTVTTATNIRKTPSMTSENVGVAEPGIPLTITVVENIQGHAWGYIQAPIQGWMIMDYFQLDGGASPTLSTEPTLPAATAPAETVPAETADPAPAQTEVTGYSVPADQVRSLSVDWLAGHVRILSSGDDRIHIFEDGINDNTMEMEHRLKDGKLSIEFCNDDLRKVMGLSIPKSKDLTIQVPANWTCHDLELDLASSTLEAKNLTAQEVELDTASGSTVFTDCSFTTLEADSASGNVDFSGTLDILEMESASGAFTGYFLNVPKRLEMESASGNMEVTLPNDAGFTIKVKSVSGKFGSDFDTTNKNGAYVHGDGSCRITMNTMSGSFLIIKQNS